MYDNRLRPKEDQYYLKFLEKERTMSTTPQFEIPTDLRKMTEQSMEQVRTAINRYLQFFQRAVPGNVMGGNELSNKVLNYAERNVASAFEFAQKLVQVKDVQDLAKLQMEFIQAQMQPSALLHGLALADPPLDEAAFDLI
jgi:hypothetical protein